MVAGVVSTGKRESESRMCSLFTELLYCSPVALRNGEPLTVSGSNVNIHRTETIILLVTFNTTLFTCMQHE